ncbi:hypothetical protein [Arthrobacter sp. NPDC057013]|uniref:hypothetical protein n=1 Tax=Arthrobacter sp. NPDC057013 TaxID=3345999 RepID=UPI003625CA7B
MAVLDIHINDAIVAVAAPSLGPRAIAASGRANVDYFPTLTTPRAPRAGRPGSPGSRPSQHGP